MKSLARIFLFVFAAAAMTYFSGCTEDGETLPTGPSLNVSTTPAADLGEITAMAGEDVELSINVSAPGGFNVLRVTLFVDGSEENQEEYIRTTSGQTSFSKDTTITLLADWVGADVEIELQAVDDDNQTTEETISIVVESPIARVYTEKLLFTPLEDRSSETFFASSTGETYTSNEVVTGVAGTSATIDFGYYWLDPDGQIGDGPTLASPAVWPDYTGFYDLGPNGQQWGTLNSTTFLNTTLTNEDLIEVTYADIDEAFDAGTISSTDNGASARNLAVDDILVFETDSDKEGGSKRGIIRVTEIVPGFGENDYIEIEVFVQEPADQ